MAALAIAGGGERRRGHRAAVEAALEDHHVGPARGHPGQPHRGLDRLGAGVGVEHGVQARGQDLAQLLGELQQRRVHHGRVLGVDDPADLLPGRLDHPGMAVARAGHPDPGGEVQVVPPVRAVDPAPPGGVDDDRGRLLQERTQ